jgi:phage terminase large subunit-like protein
MDITKKNSPIIVFKSKDSLLYKQLETKGYKISNNVVSKVIFAFAGNHVFFMGKTPQTKVV